MEYECLKVVLCGICYALCWQSSPGKPSGGDLSCKGSSFPLVGVVFLNCLMRSLTHIILLFAIASPCQFEYSAISDRMYCTLCYFFPMLRDASNVQLCHATARPHRIGIKLNLRLLFQSLFLTEDLSYCLIYLWCKHKENIALCVVNPSVNFENDTSLCLVCETCAVLNKKYQRKIRTTVFSQSYLIVSCYTVCAVFLSCDYSYTCTFLR